MCSPSPWPALGLPLAPPNPTAFTKATSHFTTRPASVTLPSLNRDTPNQMLPLTPWLPHTQRPQPWGGSWGSGLGGAAPPKGSRHRPQPNKSQIGTTSESTLGRLPATKFNTAVWWLKGVSREGFGFEPLLAMCHPKSHRSTLQKDTQDMGTGRPSLAETQCRSLLGATRLHRHLCLRFLGSLLRGAFYSRCKKSITPKTPFPA